MLASPRGIADATPMLEGRAARSTGPGLAVVTASLLATEVTLTRIFSVTIWYHFAFFAVSIAMFGTGAAALGLHFASQRLARVSTARVLGLSSAALGASILGCELVLLHVSPTWPAAEGGRLALLFVTTSTPFVLGGVVVSAALTRHPRDLHALYFWDLLGAGAGCLVVLGALSQLGAPVTLALAAALAAVGGVILAVPGGHLDRAIPAVVAAALLSFVALPPSAQLLRVRWAKGNDLDKARVVYSRWNSHSMVTVLDRSDFSGWGMSAAFPGTLAEQKLLVIDMNALTPILHFDGDFARVSQVRFDLTAFAYFLRPHAARACVIGAGGGKDVLAALASGARKVDAVEVNALIANDVMRGHFRAYAGGLYDRPDVALHVGDGRGFVRRSRAEYDVLQLSMVDTSAATAAGAYALTENTLYTTDAFADYFARLAPNGLLSVASVSMPGLSVGERLVSLARHVVLAHGGDPRTQVLVVATPWLGLANATLYDVLVKRTPYTPDELKLALRTAAALKFVVAYVPGQDPAALVWPVAPNPVMHAILTATDEEALQGKLDRAAIDVRPTTDDRPFFFYQNRLRDFSSALFSRPDPRIPYGNGLGVLAKVLAIATFMVAVFLAVPALFLRKGSAGVARQGAYVVALGLGFMAAEIGVLSRYMLYLGRPTDALSIVLLSILCGSGVGSAVYGRYAPAGGSRLLRWMIVALVGMLLLFVRGAPIDRLLTATMGLGDGMRAAIAVASLAPLGFLLGIPMPAGLRAVSRSAPDRLAWLWAVNSAAGVLGSVLSTLTSLHAGISATFVAAAAVYAIAVVVVPHGATQG